MTVPSAPKCFISYSWSSPEHEAWVLSFATDLRENGVEAILDKWYLKEGQDSHHFMEKMVSDPEITKVILVCDAKYVERADKRDGGVGVEAQIISPEIYKSTTQTKFVAAVRQYDIDGKALVPAYYGGRIHVDFSTDENYTQSFEQVLRWIYDKPVNAKPKIGKPPSFLNESAKISVGSSFIYKSAIDAIRSGKAHSQGATEEYLAGVTQGLEAFRISGDHNNLDDVIFKIIEEMKPLHDQLVSFFGTIAIYNQSTETMASLHRFFERLIPFREAPEGANGYTTWDFDAFRFFIHELFLSLVAVLLKEEKFEWAAYMLRQRYFWHRQGSGSTVVGFGTFWCNPESLNNRSKRLELNRYSLQADLLKQRRTGTSVSFYHLMQADFVLFLRQSFDSLRASDTDAWEETWFPTTLLYMREFRTSEIFARSQSSAYFERIKCLFDISKKGDFEPLWEAFSAEKIYVPKWHFDRLNPRNLVGYEQLAMRP